MFYTSVFEYFVLHILRHYLLPVNICFIYQFCFFSSLYKEMQKGFCIIKLPKKVRTDLVECLLNIMIIKNIFLICKIVSY